MASELRAAQCPACGASFGCGVETGSCWCREVELSRETLRELAADHRDCLCPTCLSARGDTEGYSDGRSPGTSRLGSSGVVPGA